MSRSGLLSSIRKFKSKGLKKVVTNDRSSALAQQEKRIVCVWYLINKDREREERVNGWVVGILPPIIFYWCETNNGQWSPVFEPVNEVRRGTLVTLCTRWVTVNHSCHKHKWLETSSPRSLLFCPVLSLLSLCDTHAHASVCVCVCVLCCVYVLWNNRTKKLTTVVVVWSCSLPNTWRIMTYL